MAEREPLLPEPFGALEGVRILSTGVLIAQPWAAHLAAEMGAEVIQIERPGQEDFWRYAELPIPIGEGRVVASGWAQERRNAFYVTLNVETPKGRDLFLRLLPHFDIWMESSKPGTWARRGLDDETVLKANPRLVIVHVSGYGQDGDPDYVGRIGYDLTGQAYGGPMYLTGFPEPDPPVRLAPWTGDYVTSLFALWSALAAYIYAQRTGRGQSIDLAQYEAMHKCLAGTMVAYFQLGKVRERSGNRAEHIQPYSDYRTQDGRVVICAAGFPTFERVCQVMGLDRDESWKRAAHFEPGSEPWVEFDGLMTAWARERTSAEVERLMNAAGVACSRVMSARDMAEAPHYQARGIHIQWEDVQLGPVRGTGVVPRFSLTPGRIWRGSVPIGYDNATVFGRLLGVGPEELASLQEEGVV